MLFLVLHRIDKELDLKILYLFKIDVKAASVKGCLLYTSNIQYDCLWVIQQGVQHCGRSCVCLGIAGHILNEMCIRDRHWTEPMRHDRRFLYDV